MKFFGKKNIRLGDVDCHLHYANNRGRGQDNVTVTFVTSKTPRPQYTREYNEDDIIKQYRVSGWRGNVNFYTQDIKKYGGVEKILE